MVGNDGFVKGETGTRPTSCKETPILYFHSPANETECFTSLHILSNSGAPVIPPSPPVSNTRIVNKDFPPFIFQQEPYKFAESQNLFPKQLSLHSKIQYLHHQSFLMKSQWLISPFIRDLNFFSKPNNPIKIWKNILFPLHR